MKKGFTLVEMMMVVAILGVLVGIVITGVGSVMKSSRINRANTMRTALEQALATYYAQTGEWPDAMKSRIESGDDDNAAVGDTVEFKNGQQDQVFQEVVGKSFGKNGTKSMVIDASALFVCRTGEAGNRNAHGIDFSLASMPKGRNRIPLAQMAFGYAEGNTGCFRRFTITYNVRTDSAIVGPSSFVEAQKK